MEYFFAFLVIILILGAYEVWVAQSFLDHIKALKAKEIQNGLIEQENCKIHFLERRVS